jgi:hypothetical protein
MGNSWDEEEVEEARRMKWEVEEEDELDECLKNNR